MDFGFLSQAVALRDDGRLPARSWFLIELDAPKLVKRFPFLFLNHLLSVRPKEELAPLFEGIREEITKINLLETTKHFPKEEWPKLWED